MLIRMQQQRMLTPEAKKRLADSGITREEILEHTDVRIVVRVRASASSNGMRLEHQILINLLSWKGRPACALSFDPLPLFTGEEAGISAA